MLHVKFMVSALTRAKTIKLLCLYHESVRNSLKARVRNSGSQFQLNLYSFPSLFQAPRGMSEGECEGTKTRVE